MFYLKTERLKLIPLDRRHLQLLQQSRAVMERSLGLEVSAMAVDEFTRREIAKGVPVWLDGVTQNEAHYRWYTTWEIVSKDDNVSIGSIGLMGLPDEYGETMMGYHVDANYQRQGVATEALEALIDWAFRHPDLKRILAETPRDNFASQRVLIKNGFMKCENRTETFVWEREPERVRKFRRQQTEYSEGCI